MALAARAYLCVGALLITLHVAVGGSVGIYQAIGSTSAGVIVLATALHRPPNALGWYGVAVAQALLAAGDAVYFHLGGATGFPGAADGLYVASYVVYIASLLALMGGSFPWRDWAGHVDTLLVVSTLGFSGWMLLLDESLQPAWTWASVVSIFYPLADLACLAVMVRILFAPGRRPLAFWLLVLSLVPLLWADGSYVVPAVTQHYAFGSWLDAGWLASYVLTAAAALEPSMARVATVEGAVRSVTVRRVVVGAVALVSLPLAATWELVVRHDEDVELLTVAALVVVTMMAVRAVMLVRELDTQRRRAQESERRFRLVFERSPVGISVGRGGMMTETNPALHAMLGYSGEELAQMHYSDITAPDEQEGASVEKEYVAKDGSVRWAHVRLALGLDDGLGISLIEDVTDRRRLEEQLREARKMEAVGELAGGIAHDFNNLMTAVLGYSDLLLRKTDEDDVDREKLEAIRDAALRAGDLTRQLLAFGRRQVLQAADVDLQDLVRGLEDSLRRVLGSAVQLELCLDPEPVVVRLDPAQFEHVLLNLAVNAREAMPAGGVLTIGVAVDGSTAVVTVADTGEGMDEWTRTRVFDPFFTTKPYDGGRGSGLGLSTVHGIVGQSGGTIEVESAPGAGTVFTVRLPRSGPGHALPPPRSPATLLTD